MDLPGDRKAGIRSVIPSTVTELKEIKKVIRKKSVEDIERLFITRALNRSDWNVTHAAKDVGMDRANFQAMMRRYNIRRSTHYPDRKE